MSEAFFTGSTAYSAILETGSAGTWTLDVRQNSGFGFWTATPQPWGVTIAGRSWSGSWVYDWRTGPDIIRLASSDTHGLYPRPLVTSTLSASADVRMDSGLGNSYPSHVFVATGTASAPATPPAPVVDSITATSMRVLYLDGPDGGTPITSRALQVANAPDFSGPSDLIGVDQSGVYIATQLIPGSPFYWRYRVQNAVGVSAWSAATFARTLSGAYLSNGSSWAPALVTLSDGVSWRNAEVLISDGAAWRKAG